MILTKCLLDEMFQSVSHVGWTGRGVLHSGHDLLLDGVDHKQEPVWRKHMEYSKNEISVQMCQIILNN